MEKSKISTIDFVAPGQEAKARVKDLLSKEGLIDVTQICQGYGYKYSCQKNDQIYYVTVYLKKDSMSSKIVCDSVPPEVKVALVRLSVGDSEHEKSFLLSQSEVKPVNTAKVLPTVSARPFGPQAERIGTDESGKGDYFGPLVTAGVYLDAKTEEAMVRLGVKDSKKSNDNQNAYLASKIKEIISPGQYEIYVLSVAQYNEVYRQIGNLNYLLADCHAKVIDRLMDSCSCDYAIVDQFAKNDCIPLALKKLGRQKFKVIQRPGGEEDAAVAAASILARDAFLKELEAASQEIGVKLIKGAGSEVDKLAFKIYQLKGLEGLRRAAKLHFRNTIKAGISL
ncbi:MAG: ribonuclease HIII [Deltaproteobacteria bacterium]|jgi:ribonuclease HIII|nr:ribonuclease HIII [Deltaproteobacteria bacterium]